MTRIVESVRGLATGPDATAFRDAMAQVASAVHIITTRGASGRAGLTATAVASVSDAPPTVLACIEAGSRTLAAIRANGVFCINTLPGDGVDLAEIFASRRGLTGEARFDAGEWRELETGSPVLPQAVAAFDCRLVAIHEVASHRILIGEVLALTAGPPSTALIYRGRRFEAI